MTERVLIREIVRNAEPGRWSEEDFASGMLDARAKPRARAILRVADDPPEAGTTFPRSGLLARVQSRFCCVAAWVDRPIVDHRPSGLSADLLLTNSIRLRMQNPITVMATSIA